MSYKQITAGERMCKPLAARRIMSERTGNEAIEVEFEFEEPTTGQMERLQWRGWLSPKAVTRTLDTLEHVLGSNLNLHRVDAASQILTDPDFLDYNKIVKIVIALETNEKDGKTYPSIKWVNNIGGSAFSGCDVTNIKARDDASGLTAEILSRKQKKPKQDDTVPF